MNHSRLACRKSNSNTTDVVIPYLDDASQVEKQSITDRMNGAHGKDRGANILTGYAVASLSPMV